MGIEKTKKQNEIRRKEEKQYLEQFKCRDCNLNWKAFEQKAEAYKKGWMCPKCSSLDVEAVNY
jgi:transcription elongation factor Elf1